MRFVRSSVSERPARLGILPGGFNPPTRAHMELVAASRAHVDEVVCVVPAKLPHKEFFGATLEQRVEMLKEADPAGRHAIAVSEQRPFADIARELREHYGPAPELYFLCGARRCRADRELGLWTPGRD